MLISEIKRRTFCKLLGVLGLSGMGCNIDYNIGHLRDENEEGEPLPICIQNPQFEPAFDDPIWREGNIKLDDFIQSIPDNDFIFSKYENDELVILIQNVPIDADIFNARHVASSGNNVFSEEQIANFFELDSDDPKVLISVEMKLPLQIKNSEYYVKSFIDTGGNFNTIPHRNSSECSADYIAWLEPKLYESVGNIIDEVIEEKKKKKKKSSGKKDACYHKVRSRYDVWPSAYASGALVKCRKVGVKNWGNKSKNEEIELEEVDLIPGGLTADLKGSMEEKHQALADRHNISVKEINDQVAKGIKIELEHTSSDVIAHEIAMDHIFEDPKYYDKLAKVEGGSDEEQKETTVDEAKRKKAGTESSKESNLRDWFKRKGAKGSKGGWVDCNSPDGKGGYKSCGRGEGEKRKKYPACRPTPSACKERGRGKSWGKKGSKKMRKEQLQRLVREEAEKTIFGKTLSEGLRFHIHNDINISDNIYRAGSAKYFALVNETRDLWKAGKLNLIQEDIDLLETDLGEFATFGGERVPLDFPMMLEEENNKPDRWSLEYVEKLKQLGLKSFKDAGKEPDPKFLDAIKKRKEYTIQMIDSQKKLDNLIAQGEKQKSYYDGQLRKTKSYYDRQLKTRDEIGQEKIRKGNRKLNIMHEMTMFLNKKIGTGFLQAQREFTDSMKSKDFDGMKNAMDKFDKYKNLQDKLVEFSQIKDSNKQYNAKVGFAKELGLDVDSILEEAKKKKKKDPPIGKPMKNTGGGKKYKVYVRGPSGRIKKITYGDSKGGLKGNWNNAEARKNFASRHNCADKKDRTKAGYWACRAHKDFGTNVPGRFW